MKQFKGIVFDFNGVLLWDTELQEKAWKEYSSKLRGSPLTNEEMEEHVHGRNNKHTLSYLVGHEVEGDELDKLTQGKESTYREMCILDKDNFRLSPGSEEFLNFLVEKEIPHTIATASEKTNLDFFIKHLNLNKWFDVNKIVYDNGSLPGKPAPDIYLKACSNIGLAPGECAVIEDAVSGIKAAKAAGMGRVFALGQKYFDENLKSELGYEAVIDNLAEVDFRTLFIY